MNNQFERGTVNRLTEKERKAAFRRWTFVAGLGWNYETQQAPSVAFAMSKALRKIYPNDEDYIEAMDNHFKYFNITPQMGNLVLGATLAMEEQDGLKAKDAVQNLKISLMGPLSGVGDSLFWVLWPTIIGGISGYYGGKLDNVLMRFAEIVYSLPFTPMIIAVASTMLWVPQSQKMYTVSLLIGLLSWPGLARLVRGQILTLREQEFMQACEALGISDFSKIFKHLLPNVISLVIVNATLQMASAILTEAGLSFLGMGVTAPTPSWGNLMNLARDSYVFQNYPWEWMPAGLMCLLTVISINLIGEGLRDAFDPKELQ